MIVLNKLFYFFRFLCSVLGNSFCVSSEIFLIFDSVVFSSGSVVFSSGSVVFSSGSVVFSSGSVVFSLGSLGVFAGSVESVEWLSARSEGVSFFDSAEVSFFASGDILILGTK